MKQHDRLMTSISKLEFDSWSQAHKLIVHDYSRKFAAIRHETSSQNFAISWRSELVDPIIVMDSDSELWVGVDQHIACVAKEGNIKLSIILASSLLDVKSFNDFVAVLCETEVILFNRDKSIRKIHGLHDIPYEITECDGNIAVIFDGGTQENIT